MNLDIQPRIQLTALPTPIEVLSNLSEHLGGPTILVKRDDQTTLGLGGNKTRKLEFLLADALDKKADTIITAGGIQSNHCRLTASAAARLRLQCELVLGSNPPDDTPNGNLLLDQLLGANIHWTEPQNRSEKMTAVARALQAEHRHPYVIPVGGSNGIGAVGYVAAMRETIQQLAAMQQSVDHIVFATSSGGTHAGLQLGAHLFGFKGQVLGISIDQTEDSGFLQTLADIANAAAQRLDVDMTFNSGDFHMNTDYMGDGYGVIGNLEREAIRLAARHEGLFVGPVYTGRALGGLIDLIRRGTIQSDETVLFWHTGDVPALFAYADELHTQAT